MRKKNDSVIRANDMVEVVNPRVVLRVGYPKSLADYLEPAKKEYGDGLRKLLAPLHPHPESRDVNRIYERITYMMACSDGFGGQKRTAHFKEMPELLGHRFRVFSMATRMEGTRDPPHYSSGGYDWEPEYEPGGLYDAKVLRICYTPFIPGFSLREKYLGFLTTDVKKVS